MTNPTPTIAVIGGSGLYSLFDPTESTREQALFENKKEAWKLPRGAPTESADVPDDRYGDGMIADEAVKRLQAAKQKPDEPFFLAVGFLKPHLPFVAPKKYWDLYDPASFKLPELQKAPEGAPEFAPSICARNRGRLCG